MLEDNLLSLLSLRMRTVKLGHRSKSSNSLSPLKDKANMSNLSDHGASLKVRSRFSFNYSTTILLVCEKAPFSILSILFLLRVNISNLSHNLNILPDISAIWLEEASTFLNPSPSGGSNLILLSLMMRCSKVLMPDKSGRYTIWFYAKISSTKARHAEIYLGIPVILLRDRSRDFRFSNLYMHPGTYVSSLFFILSNWRSTNIRISSGRRVMLLLEKSILVIGAHSHQFSPSRGNWSSLKSSGGI